MSAIELKNVTRRWGETVAVDDVSFHVEEGSFAILLGPSGCGKSTTLRMIAGLEQVSEGQLLVGERDVTHSPPSERQLSMVFQSYALFPHLNVKENILFGLKVRKVPAPEREARLADVAEIVGLGQLLDRKPSQLSGGQRQRVALARAIIAQNKICMMDEPLSNLDAKLRHEMRVEIRALQQRLNMTVMYVTHDQAEAMSMGDKVILLRNGKIEQEGTPDELYDMPETSFAASFIGTPPMNLMATEATDRGVVIQGAPESTVFKESAGHDLLLGVRPEHIDIVEDGGVEAELVSADYLGAETIVSAKIGTQSLLVQVAGNLKVPKPVTARLSWPADCVHAFDCESGQRVDTAQPLAV